MTSNTSEEVTFRLDNDQSGKFPDMFLELEKEKTSLDIVNFGLDLTTMDDVFLKIGELEEQEANAGDNDAVSQGSTDNIKLMTNEMDKSKSNLVPISQSTSGLKLIITQLYGLLVKRMIYTWRRKLLYFNMAILPIVMAVLIVLSLNPFTGNVRERPARLLDLESYTEPLTFIASDGSEVGNNLQAEYNKLVSVGVTEVTSEDLDEAIIKRSTGNENLAVYTDSMVIAADFEEVSLFGVELVQVILSNHWSIISKYFDWSTAHGHLQLHPPALAAPGSELHQQHPAEAPADPGGGRGQGHHHCVHPPPARPKDGI